MHALQAEHRAGRFGQAQHALRDVDAPGADAAHPVRQAQILVATPQALQQVALATLGTAQADQQIGQAEQVQHVHQRRRRGEPPPAGQRLAQPHASHRQQRIRTAAAQRQDPRCPVEDIAAYPQGAAVRHRLRQRDRQAWLAGREWTAGGQQHALRVGQRDDAVAPAVGALHDALQRGHPPLRLDPAIGAPRDRHAHHRLAIGQAHWRTHADPVAAARARHPCAQLRIARAAEAALALRIHQGHVAQFRVPRLQAVQRGGDQFGRPRRRLRQQRLRAQSLAMQRLAEIVQLQLQQAVAAGGQRQALPLRRGQAIVAVLRQHQHQAGGQQHRQRQAPGRDRPQRRARDAPQAVPKATVTLPVGERVRRHRGSGVRRRCWIQRPGTGDLDRP
ncbi:hypothetical protein [uncultured Xanthomonas sp.]|uniref:hypothetical protein n=1 Tax=uncultured Xanthomonas sp. TaxID=152831 RepID=UPI0025F94B50|nr:hypothetical protein [uncultured Xanthomonas sp.]